MRIGLGSVENKLGFVERKLGVVESRLGTVGIRLDVVDRKVDRVLDNQLDDRQTLKDHKVRITKTSCVNFQFLSEFLLSNNL